MKSANHWSRRKFSKAAVSAQLLFGSGLMNIAIGCSPRDNAKIDLNDESNRQILKLVMDEIIPASDTMPSASDIGGIEYIYSVFEEFTEIKTPFIQILTEINEESQQLNNDDFINLDQQQRIPLLKHYEKTKPEFFQVLVNFVYESYYTNEEVWKLIGYKPYPTLSAGPEMAPFDASLLKRVKHLSPFYTKLNS